MVIIVTDCGQNIVYAQQDENAVKAAFIYNFITFVEWPKSVKPKGHTAVICVLGEDDPVLSYLDEIKRKVDNVSPIRVERKGRDSDISGCHILYMSQLKQDDIDYMIEKSKDYPILTVSDFKGFASMGGVVGFVMRDGKVKLETNVNATRNAHLIIDSELLELMKIYK